MMEHDPRHYLAEYRDGYLVGYKWLHKGDGKHFSPTYNGIWRNGYIVADLLPTLENQRGIWCAKTPDGPALVNYRRLAFSLKYGAYTSLQQYVVPQYKTFPMVLVRLLLYEPVLEGEVGFRAYEAQIIEELDWSEPHIEIVP